MKAHLLAWLAAGLFAASVHAAELVKVGSTPGVTADAVAALAKEAAEHGLKVELVEFTDWTLPNEALNNGDIDLNFFQHQAFLDNAIQQRGYALSMVGLGLLQNIGIYSQRLQSLDAVPSGAQVAVASDPVNQGRGLLLLQRAGLIKLREGDAIGASVHDVIENPHKLRFHEIEGPQLVRALDDVDLAVLWPSHLVRAGRAEQAGKALLYSGVDDTFYAMGFVARTDQAEADKVRRFVTLYQSSPAVRQVIDQAYDGDSRLYTLPWVKP